ncbi:MAG: 2,5-diamino-6-(ribosylamino)-4(3H)-pyrimidinone 5'-phosphate reductase [Candidatus Hodarchaeales archaeon]|jgi:2,5-diamino-6-(ribosylamino)-4(3H)-pyrimidinone 5'-phosphate reductase
MINKERSYIILNCAMSIDGKIATATGDATLSNHEDWVRVHELRNSVDAIMVGINTILKDDSKLTVKEELLNEKDRNSIRHPLRIIVDSKARLPISSRVVQFKKNEVKTLVATSVLAPQDQIKNLQEQGVIIFQAGMKKVDLEALFQHLYQLGVKTLLLEGGGTLNWSILQAKLIDELRIFMAPCVASGFKSIPLFNGTGFTTMSDGPQLDLKEVKRLGNGVLLEFKVDYSSKRSI